jgi:hypothetical protein
MPATTQTTGQTFRMMYNERKNEEKLPYDENDSISR